MDEAQYRKGVEQFAQMVGRENIEALRQRFASLSPDFERCVMGFIGGLSKADQVFREMEQNHGTA